MQKTLIVTNNNVNDVSALDGPSLLSEDFAVAEDHKMADEDISILSSQVERHIFVISRWVHSVHAEAKNESYWLRGFTRYVRHSWTLADVPSVKRISQLLPPQTVMMYAQSESSCQTQEEDIVPPPCI